MKLRLAMLMSPWKTAVTLGGRIMLSRERCTISCRFCKRHQSSFSERPRKIESARSVMATLTTP